MRPPATTASSGTTIGGIYYGLDGAPDRGLRRHRGPLQRLPAAGRRLLPVLPGRQLPVDRATTPDRLRGAGPIAGTDGDLRRAGRGRQPAGRAGRTGPDQRRAAARRSSRSSPASAAGYYDGGGRRRLRPGRGRLVRRRGARRRLLHAAEPDGRPDRRSPPREHPQLRSQLSYDTEPGYDNVIVEAHPVGSDDWTTLPEAGGLTNTDVPAECEAGLPARGAPVPGALPDARRHRLHARPGPPARGTR